MVRRLAFGALFLDASGVWTFGARWAGYFRGRINGMSTRRRCIERRSESGMEAGTAAGGTVLDRENDAEGIKHF
jgi:hypothetical protein